MVRGKRALPGGVNMNVRYGARPVEAVRNRELEATGRQVWSDSLEAVYLTDAEVVAAVLPPPLEPGPEPLVRLNISTVSMPGAITSLWTARGTRWRSSTLFLSLGEKGGKFR